MKKNLLVERNFDLLEDGDFWAEAYEITGPYTVTFYGEWATYEEEDRNVKPAALHVLFENDVKEMSEEEMLSAGWVGYEIEEIEIEKK